MITVKISDESFYYDVMSLTSEFFVGEKIIEGNEGERLLLADISDKEAVISFGSFCEKEELFGLSRKEKKDRIKRALYRALSAYTSRKLPWGTLSGIRPVKLVSSMLDEDDNPQSIKDKLFETYYISEEKAHKALTIAEKERELLKKADIKNGYSLYLGIPFCPSVCLYCSFSSYPVAQYRDLTEKYVDALVFEIKETAALLRGRTLDTVYFGGGTPTALSETQLDRILSALYQHFPADGIKELTVEAGRPDSITREKLCVLREHKVSRLSINPQTMNDETLKLIGRAHTASDIIRAFDLARNEGFSNINCDLIVGLPGEGKGELTHTACEMKKLSPESLTVHSLARKRASRLTEKWDEFSKISFNNSEELMGILENAALDMEMQPYYLYRQKNIAGNLENTGFAKQNKECLYNVLIMEEKQPIIALGAGGASKFVGSDKGAKPDRCENLKDPGLYIEKIIELVQRKKEKLEDMGWL